MLKIYKLKSDGAQKLLEWGQKLMTTHKTDALQTLAYEHLLVEHTEIVTLNGTDYLVGFAVAETGKKAKDADPEHPLNKQHRAIMRDAIQGPIDTHQTAYSLRRE